MTSFLIRRFFQMLLVLLMSSIVVYMLLSFTPGGPFDELLQNTDRRTRTTQADIRRMEAALGLDKPWYLQYVSWLAGDTWLDKIGFEEYVGERKGIIRGDWGTSWRVERNQPVLDVLMRRLPDTLRLQITATVIALALAIPIGIFSAVKQYSKLDYFFTSFSFLGISIPSFWFGLMLIAGSLALSRRGYFSFPTGDIVAIRDYTVPGLGVVEARSFTDRALRLAMPVMVLTLLSLASFSRYMRSSMLEVLRQDYVRTARAKGLRERVVVLKHALRNALIPLITIVVYTIPGVFNGALITETIFNYKGMGWLYINALGQRDWPIVSSYLLINAILIVIANMLADVLYTVADPRIRLD
jgi:peptide/nickel transport system permease protein